MPSAPKPESAKTNAPLEAARAWLPGAKEARAQREAAARDIAEALAAFDALVALETAYDPRAADLYADDGVVVERRIEGGAERAPKEIPMRRYKATLPLALKISAKARETAIHEAVEAQAMAPGWVRLRSHRRSSQSREAAPYEAVLRRMEDGCWRVVKEIAVLVR
jgi:ketosteroid isomerase-like protein